MSIRLELGDCRAVLPTVPEASVHCVVTSPPYWGLRDYGVAGQLGLEATPEEYVARMVAVFREVRRVLRADGTCWVNMGDSYAAGKCGRDDDGPIDLARRAARYETGTVKAATKGANGVPRSAPDGFKPKDLVGMPWRLAFALQTDGWFLRSDIVWAKPNPMPESVTDRPTKAHEYVFLLTKAARYFYDADAVREPSVDLPGVSRGGSTSRFGRAEVLIAAKAHRGATPYASNGARNLRSVWTIAPEPYPEAHFATFPPELARRCIVAGTSAKGCCAACGAPWAREVTPGQGDAYTRPVRCDGRPDGAERRKIGGGQKEWDSYMPPQTTGWHPTCAHDAAVVPCSVLDPFAGSGTVGEVAERNGRNAVLIELSPAYVELARVRTAQRSLFATRDALGAT